MSQWQWPRRGMMPIRPGLRPDDPRQPADSVATAIPPEFESGGLDPAPDPDGDGDAPETGDANWSWRMLQEVPADVPTALSDASDEVKYRVHRRLIQELE